MTRSTSLAVFHDVACPGCGCLCDDLTVELDGSEVRRIEPACELAAQWMQAPALSREDFRIDDRAASMEEAIDAAANILQRAKAPLFFGLGETTSETVRKVVDLADRVGGILDASHPTFFDPTGRILQTTGMVTCSLGEIRHRSDLVVFWGCDPKTTHPRHWERYSVEPTGRFIPGGRSDRHVVGIGQANATTEACDAFISLSDTQQIAALHALAAWANEKPLNEDALAAQLGDALQPLKELHARIQESKYFVLVLGDGFLRREAGRVPLELLAQYVRPLHEKTRGAISILRPGPNWVGAGSVVASRTGYPGGASLTEGVPRFDPDNGSAVKRLAEKRVDAAVLFEGAWLDTLPNAAIETLGEIPTVLLTHRRNAKANVLLPIARPAVADGGTMSRLDDMPLPLRRMAETDAPPAKEMIAAILEKLA
ncbi:hypothetical protein [Blastopirellula marina]|uniref:hypothetical protein n=1 Tax=Blastopirellula marina TaxID=124 RepID=UPI0011B08490|nr:hypothetical protein [Blastopirellula marina]